MKEEFYNRLVELVSKDCVQADVLLSKYTTFRIGGPAKYFVRIEESEKLSKVIRLCNEFEVPFYVLGKGSNLLVSDQGYQGVIIRFDQGKGIEDLECTEDAYQEAVKIYKDEFSDMAVFRCQAGVPLISFALYVSRAGYTGFEFATGIPGSLGGGVVMNAGAYGGELKDHIVQATIVDRNGEVKIYHKDELQMGYRSCVVQKNGGIVTEAVFAFPKGNVDEIMAKVKELSVMRATKQPLEYPSAGSTFKRPEGYFAGKLIMDAGLRGFQVGGAQVSEKHCGFVINTGEATAKDVMELIHQVQSIVKEQFGVMLETEVKMLGDF